MSWGLLNGLFGVEPALDAYDKEEVNDLALHVRQCTRRYSALSRQQTLTIRLVMLVIGLLLLNGTLSLRQSFDTLLGSNSNPAVVGTAQAQTTHN